MPTGQVDDRLQNAWERLAKILPPQYCIWPEQSDTFSAYLKDATFLEGRAGLVLRPQSREELREIVSEANALRRALPFFADELALTLRGGGSGLSGACVPDGGVVLDLTRMNRIVELDEKDGFICAEAGVIVAELNTALQNSKLCYAVDPSSAALCTVGGSIATNAAGPSSLKYGTTRQHLAALTILTAEGKLLRAGALPTKTSMGFSLPDLFCGSEGRLGIVVEAELRLVPKAEETALLFAAFASEAPAVEFILALRQMPVRAKAIELVDHRASNLTDFTPKCPKGGALLFIELDGSENAVAHDLERLEQSAKDCELLVARDEKSRQKLWQRRKAISLAVAKFAPFRIGEDIAVPVSALAAAMQFARSEAAQRGIDTAIWGHAGDGNLHVNYLLQSKEELGVVLGLMQSLAAQVTQWGGAMSGEHGLGRLKRGIARAILPEEYFALQSRIKRAFDPHCLFNPALEKELAP